MQLRYIVHGEVPRGRGYHEVFGPPKYIVPPDRILLKYNPPDALALALALARGTTYISVLA